MTVKLGVDLSSCLGVDVADVGTTRRGGKQASLRVVTGLTGFGTVEAQALPFS